ncbi:hypothetical protein J4Q44_G00056620 [Coregonus suidteri]|uniref:Uncharacterized protein n=1 Tax=Coregonus suidteri TaxID=861788 RepID=A0AAN8M259_9TELE
MLGGCEILEQQRDEANQKLKEIEEGDGCCRAAVPDRTLMQRECRGPHCQVVVYYGYCSSSCDSVGTPKNVSMMSSTKPVTKENKVLKRRSQALLPLISELPKNMATMTFNLDSDQGMDPILKKLSKQNKNMNKMKRVSQLVTEDFTEITQKLELAQCLRQHAEVFAHQVLVKQKETQRQSMALQQSSETSLQLQQALEQVAHISSTLQDMQRYYRNQVGSEDDRAWRDQRIEKRKSAVLELKGMLDTIKHQGHRRAWSRNRFSRNVWEAELQIVL